VSSSSNGSWNDDDDHEPDEGPSVFDAFAAYVDTDSETAADFDVSDPDNDDALLTVVFTASNPSSTVSVTALMDGRVLRVELDPKVSAMTEAELAEEIVTVSTLATRQALAGQHIVIAALMQRLGQDPAETRSFLERELRLPAPDLVLAERSRLFVSRYAESEEFPR
jgi:hypothetical protein